MTLVGGFTYFAYTLAVGPPIPDGSTGSLSSTYPVELLVQATGEFCRVPKLKA